MKAAKRFAEFIILLLVIGAALYTQRGFIRDWIAVQLQPPLPQEITFKEVSESEYVQDVLFLESWRTNTVGTKEEDGSDEYVVLDENSDTEEVTDEYVDTEVIVAELNDETELPVHELELPVEINLAIPFTSQAPKADWDAPYQEACEEASFYMVHQYYESKPSGIIDVDKANEDLASIVSFEEETLGYGESITAKQTAVLIEDLYKYNRVDVLEDPTIEDLKGHLAEGRPVIVPAAGRELGNPNFQTPGPLYHMLVLRGYTSRGQFITNDPGTRNGKEYVYDFDTIMDAMHDWNEEDDISLGAKRVLVIYPN